MKIRLIAILLTLVSVIGLFGCAFTGEETHIADSKDPNFLSAEAGGLPLTSEKTSDEGELMNLAATDGDGKALYQIVYAIGAGTLVEDQCASLAADIYDVTGVEIPVVHSSLPQREHEILIGRVPRAETIDVIDNIDLEEDDFAIRTVGKRVLVYAKSDQAILNAILYLTEMTVQKSSLQRLYAIAADYSFLCHYDQNPPVRIERNDDDRYVSLVLENGPMMYTYARLSYTGNNAWRIQTKYRAEDEYRDVGASQQLAYSLGEYELGTEDERFYTMPLSTSQTGDIYTVTAPDGMRAEIDLASFGMNFYTPKGKIAATITNLACGAGGSKIAGALGENEAIFGTGERMNSANQRGKKIEMFTKDIWSQAEACYMAIPLFSFSRGSGVFINNYEHMILNLDYERKNQWSANVTGAPIDCYVFAVDEIAEVIHGYSRLSGYAEMPEEWTYGMLVCAYGPDLSKKWTSQIKPSSDGRGEGVYEMIANMEANDLPWTGVIAEGWSRYDSSTYKDLKELCDYVHSLGKKFMVYWRVGYASSTMKGYSAEYLVTQTQADGRKSPNLPDTSRETNNPDVGSGARTHVYLDVTNPEATAWFFDEFWDSLANEVGVDGCKIDFCETLPENYELNYFDKNIPTAGSHHWYPTAFCTMFYDMVASKPDGGMCYTRGGGIGAQRAPYMWAGDQVRMQEALGWQITAVLSSGLSGVPYMSYDMAGYQYNDTKDPTLRNIENEAVVFIRGTQFTAFTICMQTHGKVRRSYQFAEYTDENGEHPYEYVTNIYGAYTKLHEHLTPYLTELCEEASTTGMPVVRHLVLGWQNDPNVYPINNEFMLGDAFLIAPITSSKLTRPVYLPEGKWMDLNTGEIYEVGKEGLSITVNAENIAELPTFYNMNTEDTTASELVDGIKELYAYAKTLAPAAE